MRLRPRALVFAALLALPALVLARPALAWSYGDTLTVICYPLPSLPALVRPGDTLTVWANAPSSASGWAAGMRFGALEVALPAAGGGWIASKARWELRYRVPDGTPEEVYDLWLTSASTLPDTSRHAVKVLPAFLNDFYFAQVSDTHLPTHALSNGSIDTADTTGMADFDAVIEDLNLIHPQFIIHTGDIVNEGELEEYLSMYEMGRAKEMLSRLRDPIFVSSGNHDQGGWGATAPPDGTSRKNWWRHYGWPWLGSPPAGDPYHSQDFSFDYGLLHVIGLEAYINSGSYDHYMQNIWGAQSFTPEQMSWLSANIAAVPAGHAKLAFYHYDFGGTLANGNPGSNFSQINPATLGLDGVIWGHNHGVAEGNRTAKPFNLGLQSVIDRRAFRIFRVSGTTLTPGPMHRSGGISGAPTDSMSIAWSGANNGTQRALTATINNRFGEPWEHARVIFNLADHDSEYTATGGSVAEVIREGGVAHVYVDASIGASAIAIVSATPTVPVAGAESPASASLAMADPVPNPWRAGGSAVSIALAVPARERLEVGVYDVSGRRVASLFDGWLDAGRPTLRWDGHGDDGAPAPPGLYLVRLRGEGRVLTRRLALVR